MALVEKNANPNLLQQDFMERVMNAAYGAALDQEKLRPVAQPQVTVKKFVPYTTLEIEAEVDVIGNIKLVDYKKTRLTKEAPKVTTADIKQVLQQLQTREAEKKDVDRAAKDGDQTIIDFTGVDAKTKEPLGGADGKTAYLEGVIEAGAAGAHPHRRIDHHDVGHGARILVLEQRRRVIRRAEWHVHRVL